MTDRKMETWQPTEDHPHFDEEALRHEIERMWGNYGAHMEVFRSMSTELAKLRGTMANGLTEAETNATPSCAGLTVQPWPQWFGGECPVMPGQMVEIRYRNGDTDIDPARFYRWSWTDSPADIVAYRVL